MFLKTYTLYVSIYNAASAEIVEYGKKHLDISDWLLVSIRHVHMEPKSNGILFWQVMSQSECTNSQPIFAYLIQPVQRIPRYKFCPSFLRNVFLYTTLIWSGLFRLLLADLFKHTESNHRDYRNLETALEMVGEVANFVNTKTAEAEKNAKVPN